MELSKSVIFVWRYWRIRSNYGAYLLNWWSIPLRSCLSVRNWPRIDGYWAWECRWKFLFCSKKIMRNRSNIGLGINKEKKKTKEDFVECNRRKRRCFIRKFWNDCWNDDWLTSCSITITPPTCRISHFMSNCILFHDSSK